MSAQPGSGSASDLPPAVRAFDQTAPRFDARFGSWLSVAEQRRAVRHFLTRIFPPGSRLLEIGAGTGEDAIYLLQRGYRITVTDGSPQMVDLASHKVREAGFGADRAVVHQLVLERLDEYERATSVHGYDGVYSNFAALNCVQDVRSLAAPLARLVRPGGRCVLVVFGTCPLGEVVVEMMRGRPRNAFRRFRAPEAHARLGDAEFSVWYPKPRDVAASLVPYFRIRSTRGIGIVVPPSAAEPWISGFPRVIRGLAIADGFLSAPLASFADHVLLHLERTSYLPEPR